MNWTTVCTTEDIVLDSGVAALVDGQQVAVFRIESEGRELFYAVGNYDPFSKANVISRGIVGSIGEDLVIASPIYKQHFRLTDGQCIEDESQSIGSWTVQIEEGKVMVAACHEEVAA